MADEVPHPKSVDRHNEAARVEDSHARKTSVSNADILQMTKDAKLAASTEKSMTLRQAIKLYPKACGWSVLLSTAIIMEGYDTSLLSTFFAFPPFTKRYGVPQPNTDPVKYQITPAWQNGLSNGAQCGEIIGLYAAGIIVDKIGYRKTMIYSLFAMACFIFIPFFAHNLQTLLVGEILQGIPWGVFQTMTTAYASEVAPVSLRAYLTTYVNLCWVIGQFISAGVLRAYLDDKTQWAYRVPFAVQWIWPLPLLVGCLFAPESPWWYVRQGRVDEAKTSLLRLTTEGADPDFNADDTIAMMVYTNELEKKLQERTRYIDCFKGVDLRRTEIVCMVWVIQSLCGSSFMGFSTYFYENAGLADKNAFNLNMVQYALGAIGTIGSWFAMAYIGRRTLYVGGLFVLFWLLMIIGFVGIAPQSNHAASWAIGSMLLVYTFIYDLTVGPVCYSLVSELSSTRLKAKTIVLARNFYNMGQIINFIITPRMLNPLAWNWSAKAGFFWAGLCAICFIWSYFRLPEPKGRTYGELDVLFENHIPARKFASTDVDQFSADSLESIQSTERKDPAHEEKPV
ncbi:general alpha-glucoside permease [Xylogone sp. PMI_703]|nr:general alpha-glucoside permease [Xylogone sp. PMI_703]